AGRGPVSHGGHVPENLGGSLRTVTHPDNSTTRKASGADFCTPFLRGFADFCTPFLRGSLPPSRGKARKGGKPARRIALFISACAAARRQSSSHAAAAQQSDRVGVHAALDRPVRRPLFARQLLGARDRTCRHLLSRGGLVDHVQ